MNRAIPAPCLSAADVEDIVRQGCSRWTFHPRPETTMHETLLRAGLTLIEDGVRYTVVHNEKRVPGPYEYYAWEVSPLTFKILQAGAHGFRQTKVWIVEVEA